MTVTENSKKIWDFFSNRGYNDYAISGLVGNLYAESMLKPDNLQNTCEKRLKYSDKSYTIAVDSGLYTNFCKDRAGYGLAQWTHPKRKEKLLQYAKSKNKSISDLSMQLEFIDIEIRSSSSLFTRISNAKSIKSASDIILKYYENPSNQCESVKQKREEFSSFFYYVFNSKSNPELNPVEIENNYLTYIVKKGDSLWNISKRYLGNGSRYKEILRGNGKTDSLIRVGDVLFIPTT